MKKVLAEALEVVKPSEEERNDVSDRVKSFMKKLKKHTGVQFQLGGSGAKGTWTKGIKDADVYAKFSLSMYKDKSAEISDVLEKLIKVKGVKRLHGSRDYYQVRVDGFLFEIIPIMNITNADQALNITDISPLHTKYVIKNKKYQDDIILAKAFFKANGIYGAESYIKGMSGYVIEVLVIHYGGFEKFVRACAKWGEKVVLDPKKYHKNVLLEVNKSKLDSPLILIDPVERGRNAAAAVGEEKFADLVSVCKKFVKKAKSDYFIPQIFSLDKVKGDIVLEVSAKSGKQDVVGSKLLKVFEYVDKRLDDFSPKGEWHWDGKAWMWWKLKHVKLSEYEERIGPPVKIEHAVKKFKKKYRKAFVKKGRMYAKVKRDERDVKDIVNAVIREKYVQERVKGVKWLTN
jgi:tRNA nucleotidyltransferase (CCA-adding enzyme)